MDLSPQLLLHAYSLGIFPMAECKDNPEVVWMAPKLRGVIPLDGFHISRSLRKAIESQNYSVSLNKAFPDVVDACADRNETWINSTIRKGYLDLFDVAHAQSIEVWRDGKLIGGVYGVTLGAAFFGESMFSRATNGSKIALAYLVAHLNKCGFALFDTQFLTTHLATLGAIEISREDYLKQLEHAIQAPERFRDYSAAPSVDETLQRRTHTS